MRNFVYILIVFLTLSTILCYSRFVPSRNKVHFGHIAHSRVWKRWCSYDTDCGHGYCRAYTCHCYRGYISWLYMEVCAYEQRQKLTAFLLSFFVGIFGVDWFYLSRGEAGYVVVGIIKLLISLGCLIGWPFVISTASKKNANVIRLGNVINTLLSVIALVWWLTDWIRVLADVFYDGYRAPLQPWRYSFYDRNLYNLYD